MSSCVATVVSHLSRASTAPGGLDAGLMQIQYSTPLIAALLLKLIKLRETHPQLLNFATKEGMANLAAAVVRAGGSLGEARVVMRTFGMLPMLDWLLKLHPKPVTALINFFLRPSLSNFDLTNPKVLDTIRVLLLSGFYIGEHVAWLGAKGVLPISPETIGKAAVISIRSWAVDVGITVVRLLLQYQSLQSRTAALKVKGKSAGYDVSSEKTEGDASTSEAAALKAEWTTWQQAAKLNFAWIPLTIHWSVPGGLWTNPLITAAIGSYVAYAKTSSVWARTAA